MTDKLVDADLVAGVPLGAVFIDGAWSEPPPGTGQIEVVNPANEEVIATVPDCGAETVAAAFDAAQRALPAWSAVSPQQRADLLDRLAQAIEARGRELPELTTRELGMLIRESLAVNRDLPVRVLRSFAGIARSFAWEHKDASGSTVVREAAGVVLAITPWNFPVHQIVVKLAAALAAGCTVVCKPAEQTPFNALFLGALCHDAGLPPGVVNIVTGTGATTGEALARSDGYDVLSFTGSLGVGRHLGQIAGGKIVRATLELGGKSPAVVLEDADLETAVRTTVKNCFTNAGQKCNAPSRLIVPEHSRERAVAIAAETAAGYVLGDPFDDSTTMGPLVSAAQRDRVLGFVARAERAGARVLRLSTLPDGPGYFAHPAIVTDVDRGAEIANEEVFGPVLVILGADGEQDAVQLANATRYGLSAEVWSADPGRVAALARRLQAGQVRVNGIRTPALPVSPFGGYKASGLGREMGPFGLEEFLETKAILGDPGR